MNLPSIINIELTNKCNKKCWMCGRRKIENLDSVLYNKEIDIELLEKIEKQIPDGTLIQFHNNGDPLLYSKLKEALQIFSNKIRCFNTNGKLLLQKANEFVGNVDTITISTFELDTEWEEQYNILKQFLELKTDTRIIIRCLGNIEESRMQLYKNLNCQIVTRILHSPMGSFEYTKKTTIPEHGICLEILNHPAIDVDGNVSVCVRFDPDKIGVLGNLNTQTFEEIWNSEKRKEWIKYHILGNRNKIEFCKKCDFWGIPRGV